MLGKCHGHTQEHGNTADKHQQEPEGSEPHGLEEEISETNNAVDTALRQHTGNQHGDGSRCCSVSVCRQRMERNDEGFRAESDEEKSKRDFYRVVAHHPRDNTGKLCKVQRVSIGI